MYAASDTFPQASKSSEDRYAAVLQRPRLALLWEVHTALVYVNTFFFFFGTNFPPKKMSDSRKEDVGNVIF